MTALSVTVNCSCGKSAQGMGYYDLMETHLMNQESILDLNTDPGFRWLWPRMRERETWEKFIYWLDKTGQIHPDDIHPIILFVDNPSAFADKCAEFFGYGKGEE